MFEPLCHLPDEADADDRGEATGQLVSAQAAACVHTRHDLDTLQTHKLKVVVIETVVRQNLHTQKYTLAVNIKILFTTYWYFMLF